MHPVEHLYYFSAAYVPSLYVSDLSPLVFLYNFVHLILAPCCGHSGFEDHFQSDQFHYVHHAKFECNYGGPGCAFIDVWFGTFRERLGTSREYQGEWRDGEGKADIAIARPTGVKSGSHPARRPSANNGSLGFPASLDQFIYTTFSVVAGVLLFLRLRDPATVPFDLASLLSPNLIAFLVAFAPVILALLLCLTFKDRLSWRWPFHKEAVFGSFGMTLLFGLAEVTPVWHAVRLACPGADEDEAKSVGVVG
eukprot:CAMPEP_0184498338 /NCGR_PEP_ID=MMETSP0113_2-20130426/38699_1 /TAXON_ID=91329 /ORGANISM="Norrisiella sphaerica, Strain BC52" /LENGTH=250 /DNA_ID=CAMNT_0026885799 /DNA_START=666 /DNA_END=1418 /DNA_ORIENTATION=+